MIVGRRTFWLRRRHSLVKRRGKLPGSSSITRWTWKAALYVRSRQIFAKVELYLHRYLTRYYNVICCLNTGCYSECYATLAARTRTRPGDESLAVRRGVLDCGSGVHVRSHTGVACTLAYCGVKIALLPLPAAAPHAGQLIMAASLSLIVDINWSYCCSFPCEKS